MKSVAILGGGCFWCFETLYRELHGVESVVSGYSGGYTTHPTDREVYEENTGHAEVVQITFDSNVISYRQILEIFYTFHDPTTLNRQGYDKGEEYRSIILYQDSQQRQIAEDITSTFATELWEDPVVTQIVPFEKFWPAAEYHQDFYNKGQRPDYCQVIINPKLQKFRQTYALKLKSAATSPPP